MACGAYVLIAPRPGALPEESFRHEVGESVGVILAWIFGVIYGRTLLKIILRQGPLLERLLPEGISDKPVRLAGNSLLRFLDRSHPYVGVIAVLLVFGHALLMGLTQANLLLQAIVALALWQFFFGLFLLRRYQTVFMKNLKRYGYLAHSQLYTGISIGVFALFGHLLVGD